MCFVCQRKFCSQVASQIVINFHVDNILPLVLAQVFVCIVLVFNKHQNLDLYTVLCVSIPFCHSSKIDFNVLHILRLNSVNLTFIHISLCIYIYIIIMRNERIYFWINLKAISRNEKGYDTQHFMGGVYIPPMCKYELYP